jgi:hypothetical protein
VAVKRKKIEEAGLGENLGNRSPLIPKLGAERCVMEEGVLRNGRGKKREISV